MAIGTDWYRGLFGNIKTYWAFHLGLHLGHEAVVLGGQDSLL